MAALLIYSEKCNHCNNIIGFLQQHQQLMNMVKFHNVNTMGIPSEYASKINRVPTMLTTNGKLLVGNEIKAWLESLLPNEFSACEGFGGCNSASITGEDGDGGMFSLDSYGQSLQPALTPELEAKINKSVSEAFNEPRT
jgi:hypothetical protein